MVGKRAGVRNITASAVQSENSAYRNQAWGGCYAGAEGGDLALPLKVAGLDPVGIFAILLDTQLFSGRNPNLHNAAHLPAALQLHLVPHLHLPKAII